MNPFVGFKTLYRRGKRLNVVGMPHVSGIENDQLVRQAKLDEQPIALPRCRLYLLAVGPEWNHLDAVAGPRSPSLRQMFAHAAPDAKDALGPPQNEPADLVQQPVGDRF